MKEIARGAEAVLYLADNRVVKKRITKSYRHPELDAELRKSRSRREAKVMRELPVKGPVLLKNDDETIEMGYVKGKKVAEILDEKPEIAKQIGEYVAVLHDKNIIHGDLTTSNIMLTPEDELVLIDFGLSFYSDKIEDKAVDIHLFKEALESKHFRVEKKAYEQFLKGYRTSKQHQTVLERLKKVEERGRYKNKGS